MKKEEVAKQFELERNLIIQEEEKKSLNILREELEREKKSFEEEKIKFEEEKKSFEEKKIKFEELLKTNDINTFSNDIADDTNKVDKTTNDNLDDETNDNDEVDNEAINKLKRLTKEELLKLCETKNIEVNPVLKKNEIINFIMESLS